MSDEFDVVDNDDTGTTEQLDDDVVPFEEVGDEDLDAYLNASIDNEKSQSSGPATTKTQEVQTPSEETGEKVEEPDPNAPLTRAEFNALLERLNKQEKKVDGQELLIQRRTSELGETKKQLKDLAKNLEEKFNEAIENDSQADALDIRDALKATKQQLKAAENEETQLVRRSEAQKLLLSHVPEEQLDIESMAECLARDGVPTDYVEAFKKDPIGLFDGEFSPGLTLVHVAKRAQAESMLKKLFPIAKSLADKVKQLENKEGDVLKKVQQVARQTPQISASGARPSKQGKSTSIDESQIANLSDAELEEFLASN